jgi:transcriptional regulator with XRE-family HTH domain
MASRPISKAELAFHIEVSRRIEELRKERRVKHVELARAAGIGAKRLYGYQINSTRWPSFRLRLIADFFDVPLADLIPASKDTVVFSCETRKDL